MVHTKRRRANLILFRAGAIQPVLYM